jgi:hypothetical protein
MEYSFFPIKYNSGFVILRAEISHGLWFLENGYGRIESKGTFFLKKMNDILTLI